MKKEYLFLIPEIIVLLTVIIALFFGKGIYYCREDADCICCDFVYLPGGERQDISLNKRYSDILGCGAADMIGAFSNQYEPICASHRCSAQLKGTG